MNAKAIKYGRIKRLAPDKIVVTKAQISDAMERMNERKSEVVTIKADVLSMADKVWASRHL